MLGDVFYWVFSMSIVTIICTLPLLLLRFIKRIPRRFFVWLWLIPLVRMSIPVGIASPYGVMAFLDRWMTKSVTIYEVQDNPAIALTMTNSVGLAENYFPITYKMDLLGSLFDILGLVWLVVALAMILTWVIIYVVTMRELKDAQHLQGRVYVSEKVTTPGVYGVISPKIMLPATYDETHLPYILLHEEAHIKRFDYVLRVLALLVVCAHWFNPVAWVCLKLLYADMELACDEKVLAGLGEAQKKDYAHALLSTAEGINVFAATFGGAKLRTRIENILSYRKITRLSFVAFLLLIILIVYVLLTNALSYG